MSIQALSPNRNAAQPVLSARGLTKHFPVSRPIVPWGDRKDLHAADEVDLDLYAGRVTALVGESGSGKSTVARVLARLYPPTSGRVFFQGNEISKLRGRSATRRYRSLVQLIFQDPFASLNPVRRVDHHLMRPLEIHGIVKAGREDWYSSQDNDLGRPSGHVEFPGAGHRAAVRQRVNELLTTVGLVPPQDYARAFPHQLSGGQRQRVAIARALAVEPIALLADEPISMLDVSIRVGILNLILKLKEERNLAFLYITHDLASARYVADEVMVMYAGQVVERGATEAVLQEPLHPYTKLLLSAVPNPEAGLQTHRVESRGEVQSVINPIEGCRFAQRCPLVMDQCRSQTPELGMEGTKQWVRCHLYPNRSAAPQELTLAS